MDGIIIDGKRCNADEVADMLHDNDDDEVVGIPNNGDQSDEEPDELIDETQLPHRVRNRAERDYPILDEGEISDEFLNADEQDISILETVKDALFDQNDKLGREREECS